MPDSVGAWSYNTDSNAPVLKGKTGALEVAPAAGSNHGPVSVRDTFHFGYADGDLRQLPAADYLRRRDSRIFRNERDWKSSRLRPVSRASSIVNAPEFMPRRK